MRLFTVSQCKRRRFEAIFSLSPSSSVLSFLFFCPAFSRVSLFVSVRLDLCCISRSRSLSLCSAHRNLCLSQTLSFNLTLSILHSHLYSFYFLFCHSLFCIRFLLPASSNTFILFQISTQHHNTSHSFQHYLCSGLCIFVSGSLCNSSQFTLKHRFRKLFPIVKKRLIVKVTGCV